MAKKEYNPGSMVLAKMMKGYGDMNVGIGERLPMGSPKIKGLPILTGKSFKIKSVF